MELKGRLSLKEASYPRGILDGCISFSFFFFSWLFRAHPQYMEVPRLGVESEL